MIFTRFLLILGLACFVAACEVGMDGEDYSEPLVNGYRLDRTSAVLMFISYVDEDGRGYALAGRFVDYAHDDRYILAVEQCFVGVATCFDLAALDPSDPKFSKYEDVIPLAKDPDRFQYWIIDTIERENLGPFQWEEFERKRRAFGISATVAEKGETAMRSFFSWLGVD